MLFRGLLGALLAAGIMVGTAKPVHAQAAEAVAAIVNDEVISTFDVRQRMRFIIATTGIQPDEQTLPLIRDQALRALIDERLQLQEAEKFEATPEDSDVDQEIARIAAGNGGTPAQLEQDLSRAGVGVSTFRDQVRAEIAWRRLVSGRYGSRIRVSTVQINETLARIEANATKPQYLLREIFLDTETPEEQARAVTFAQTLIDQVRQQNVPFPALAQQYSTSPSAMQGGDLGWMLSGELRPEIEAALQILPAPAANAPALSAPIEVPGGVYVVELRAKREGANAPTRVGLAQMVVQGETDAALRTLRTARERLRGCGNAAEVARRADNAALNDLGEVDETTLANDIRTRVQGLKAGEATEPFEADGGAQILLVCTRRFADGSGVPGREEIEDRLFDQQLGMFARRWLRDLRREASIQTR